MHVRLIIVPCNLFIGKVSLSIGDSFDSYCELKRSCQEILACQPYGTQLVHSIDTEILEHLLQPETGAKGSGTS